MKRFVKFTKHEDDTFLYLDPDTITLIEPWIGDECSRIGTTNGVFRIVRGSIDQIMEKINADLTVS